MNVFLIGILSTGISHGQQSLTAIEDSYIQGGASAGTNFNDDARLQTRPFSNETYVKQSFIKFDVTDFTLNENEAAFLKLYCTNTYDYTNNNRQPAVNVRKTGNDWEEETLTWNNAPAIGDIIKDQGLVVGEYVAIDVTAYVEETIAAGNDSVSFALDGAVYNYWNEFAYRLSDNPPLLVAEVPNYTLSTSAANGIVTLDPSGGEYSKGTEVTLTAQADAGYAFTNWSGDDETDVNPLTVVMDKNKSIDANFSPLADTISVPCDRYAPVRIEAEMLDKTTSDSYGIGEENDITYLHGLANEAKWHYQIDVGGEGGTFQFRYKYRKTKETGNAGVRLMLDGGYAINDARFASQVFISQNVTGEWEYITKGNFELTPGKHVFTIAGWSSDIHDADYFELVPVDGSLSSDIVVTPLNIAESEYGTVTKDPDYPAGGYIEGDEVQLTAVADEYFSFDNWSGDITGDANPVMVTMDGEKNITANFKAEPYLLNADKYETDTIQMESYHPVLSVPGTYGTDTISDRVYIPSSELNQDNYLTYPIQVGESGGEFIFKYGFRKTQAGGSIDITLNEDDPVSLELPDYDSYPAEWDEAELQEPISLPAGDHLLKIGINGSNNEDADYFSLTPVPNSLDESVRPWDTIPMPLERYGGVKIQSEWYDRDSSSVFEVRKDGDVTYVTDIGNYEELTYYLNVGGDGGTFRLKYRFKKTRDVGTIRLKLDGEWIMDNNLGESVVSLPATTDGWEYVTSTQEFEIPPGIHEFQILGHHSNAHITDYFYLIPVEGSLTHIDEELLAELNITAENGTVNKDPDYPPTGYFKEDTVVLNAVADQYYHFDSWSGDLTGTANPDTIVMDGDKEIIANFKPNADAPRETLTIEMDEAIGAYSLSPELPEEGGYVRGTEVSITVDVIDHRNYRFDAWTIEVTEDTIENQTLIVQMDSSITVKANFKDKLEMLPGDTYFLDAEEYVTDTIQVEWYHPEMSDPSDFNVLETPDKAIILRTNLNNNNSLAFPLHVGGGGGDFIFTYGLEKVQDGGALIITVDDGDEIQFDLPNYDTYPTGWVEASLDEPIRLTPGDHILKIRIQDSGTEDADYFTLTPVEGTLGDLKISVDESVGSVTRNPDKLFYDDGESVELTATPEEGYEFAGWSGDLTSEDATVTVTMDSVIYLTASFVEISQYQLTITAENGTVIKSPDADMYNKGMAVELTATPDEGYEFSGWSGDLTSEDATVTITMDSAINLTANFELIIGLDRADNISFEVYPNPSNGMFKVISSATATYSVYDLTGYLLEQGKVFGDFDLDLTKYNSGAYFLLLKTKEGVDVKRLLIK